MSVIRDAGSGDPPDVPAEVEAVRPVHVAQRVEPLRAEPVDLERLVVGELAEARAVTIRRDEKVARRIGKLVQQHERALAAVYDEMRLVVSARGGRAQEAGIRLICVLDV